MLRTYFNENFYDMPVDTARKYAEAIADAIRNGKSFEGEKKQGYLISRNRGFEDKLYVGNIERIERNLKWKGEELADDDEIINVVVIDGPITRDGDGCSYGSKDHRNDILYANTIPQVKGHIFIINTPGGAASSRIDYEQAIADCREKGKATVAWVDGLCCSAGQLLASLCDRTIVMNPKDTMGCIGTMCAFWGVANGTVSQDGFRYIELVSVTSPEKNAEYREACDGKTEKLQAELDRLGDEFRDTVRRNRPLVKEEHLTGKTFEAQEVMGALVDEIGDYTRAIEAVFEIAGGTLPAARTVEPGTQENPANQEKPEENSEMAKLNEEQKAAIAGNAGKDLTIGNGKVTKTEEGFFGLEEKELGNHQNQGNMTEEEKKKKAEEAAAAQATENEKENGAQAGSQNSEKTIEELNTQIAERDKTIEERDQEIESLQATIEEQNTQIADKDKTIEERDKKIVELTEEVSNFEGITEERDQVAKERDDVNETLAEREKTIEDLNTQIADKDKTIEERDKTIESLQATIEEQKQQLSAKDDEIKELAGAPDPMANGNAGIPADNGTGAAPKKKTCRITSDMTYEEIRAAQKQQ